MIKCTNCSNEFEGNFCPVCGARASVSVHCTNCGAEVPAGTNFCSNCGSRVGAQVANVNGQKSVQINDGATELQNELYSLYKILEPVRELDLAGLAIDGKIEELTAPLPDANKKFYDDFAHYAPFISVELDEDFFKPSDKTQKKQWKEFIKNQKNKLYGKKYDPTDHTKYIIGGFIPADYTKYNAGISTSETPFSGPIYNLFQENKDKVLSDLGASFLYYKMDYCYNPNNKPRFYKWRVNGMDASMLNRYTVMSMRNFVFAYLKEKLGDKYDDYLYAVFTKLNGGNKGELQLHDIPDAYNNVDQHDYNDSDKVCDYFYSREDFPEVKSTPTGSTIINIDEIEEVAKNNAKKSMRIKIELDSSIAELRNMRKKINTAIDEYMKGVNNFISEHVKITPYNYASQWRCVTYFLHLLMNKRGRDVYEIINQYEIDMKHKELTSALGNIQSEISNQTNVLGNKLDNINRSIINMTNEITSALAQQTKVLGAKLDGINYSVVSTGASIVSAVKQLGASMGDALNNLNLNVSLT